MGFWVFVVKALDVGEYDKKTAFGEGGHVGGEIIVVAEFCEFVGGDCVVCVYDGDYAHCKKLVQGVLCVFAADGVVYTIACEQNLRSVTVVCLQKSLIDLHEHCLAYCGGGLAAYYVAWALFHAQAVCAYAYRAAGDEDYFLALVVKVGKHPAKLFDSLQVKCPVRVSKRCCADFHNSAFVFA